MENKKLTIMQKRFCDYYIISTNGKESAIKAGYAPRSAAASASETLTRPNVIKYLRERSEELRGPRMASMEEVRTFWTEVLRDEEGDMRDRIKTSELIARSFGAFLDRVEQTGDIGLKIEWVSKDET